MEAILLAGGFGTRIRPLTYTRPKPLLPMLNRALLEGVLEKMPKEIDRVILPVNYLGDMIRAHFEEHPDPRLIITDEPEPMGTGGAIKRVEKHITGPFLVYNADIVCSIDVARFIAEHRRFKAKATISLWPVKEPWHFGVVRLNGTQRIHEFVEKPPQGKEPSNLINAGHYLLDPKVLDEIPPNQFVSLEREVFEPMARREEPVYGHRFEGYWIDCGRPQSYLEAHETLLRAQGRSRVVADGCDIARDASFESYSIGEACVIGGGSRIERSVLLPETTVGKNVRIAESVIGEGCEIEDGVVLERCVVGDYATVAAGSHVKDQRIGMRPGDKTVIA